MLRPGEYADALRALALSMEPLKARRLDIEERADALVVSWQTAAGDAHQRTFDDNGLNFLRVRARAMRDGEITEPIGERVEFLRTIGQNLDQQGFREVRVSELTGGYRVTGTVDGQYMSQWYTHEVLRATSEERRGQRAGRVAHERLPAPPDHLRRQDLMRRR